MDGHTAYCTEGPAYFSLASVPGGGGDSARHTVCRGGVGGGGHRTGRLRWSCETSTLTGRGSDDRGEIGAVRAAGEGR